MAMPSATLSRVALALLLWAVRLAPATAQAPLNDDPCGAIVLTRSGNLCTSPTVGTNAGATTTVVSGHANPTPGCGGGPQPRDVWYAFQTAATGLASFGATLTVTGHPAGQLRLYAAPNCTGPFTLVECSAATTSNTAAPRLVTGALQANRYYYVAVNGYADADQPGAFTICLTDGPGAPVCGAPYFLGSGSVNATSAQIGFQPGANGAGPYQAVLTGGGTTQTVSVAASPLQLTGLLPATTYQLTLTGQCASGGATPSVGFSFTTPTAYCLAGLGGSCSGNYITGFALLNTSLNNSTQLMPCEDGRGAGTPTLPAYTYYAPASRPSYTATLLAGATYQTAVSADGNSSVSAWLDSNQDGAFDASEWTQLAVSTQNGQPTIATLIVPATALPGPTGLRIRSRTAGSPNTAGAPCANFNSGEVEDYTVTVALPTATRPVGAVPAPLHLYPNPAAGQLTVEHPRASAAARLTVYNFVGRRVASFTPAAGGLNTPVDLGPLAKGNYLVVYTDAAVRLTAKCTHE
ncbi:GEVED domain-containing protein [Hymenobacter ruricola]|uniref:T9SS type A sorting domain-containing protein n=1 Tax=Hymenobacter ruricola TaxID=2791023 RepID=A0ABS0I4C7_9BACT|nr:GEVED domain-containing protein [Hymenobacter ruricola]MBF9221815.1 T9SS type A sorting domain-containing protein [Hymenobacter ruricola]